MPDISPALGSLRPEPLLCGTDGGNLLRWFEAHRRTLPWRVSPEPYAVWVSEIMLQQTQVKTVLPFFERWMKRFPTVEELADASEEEALSLWQGLGYYRRCRMLLAGAMHVKLQGLPSNVEEWRSVPGVGKYTANAIASISQRLPVPVVDGNVERVYARVAGDDAVNPELQRRAWQWAERHLYRPRPGDWNQALMELGATVCKPLNPDCSKCPLAERCVARQSWRIAELPTPSKKPRPVHLKQIVWVPHYNGLFGIRKIAVREWWEGMWEFPRVDATAESGLETWITADWLQDAGHFRHSVTHHRILVHVKVARCTEPHPCLRWEPREELAGLPMPSPQRKALNLAEIVLGLSPVREI